MAATTIHRLTGEEMALLTEAGHVSERAELLDGVIHEHMTPSPHHYLLVTLIAQELRTQLSGTETVLEEKPVELSKHSYPEPDVAIVSTLPEGGYPLPGDLILVLEVADSSLPHDLGPKADLYRASGVACYAVIDLKANQLTQPDGFDPVPERFEKAIERVLHKQA